MNSKFKCTECDRLAEKFIATIEGPEGTFDETIHYCHFCDLGFYRSSTSRVELVEIEKPAYMFIVSPSEDTEISII
jgi:hypothetical protein